MTDLRPFRLRWPRCSRTCETSARFLARRSLPFLAAALLATGLTPASAQKPQAAPARSQYPALPTEFPAHFTPPRPHRDFTERVVEIPMRDGAKLKTVVLIPNGATHAGIT
ncbi:MAG: hypothetical protein ACRD1M_18110 [Terriglobales bacterium]